MNGSTNNTLLFMKFIWQKSKEYVEGRVYWCQKVNQPCCWCHASCQKVIFIGKQARQATDNQPSEANKSLAGRVVCGGKEAQDIYIYMIPGTGCKLMQSVCVFVCQKLGL